MIMNAPDSFDNNLPAKRPYNYIDESVCNIIDVHSNPLYVCPYAPINYIKIHG